MIISRRFQLAEFNEKDTDALCSTDEDAEEVGLFTGIKIILNN